jgi:hypothetical protein
MFRQKAAIYVRELKPVVSEVDLMAGNGSYKGIP